LKRFSHEELLLFAALVLAIVEVELCDSDGSIQTFVRAALDEEEKRHCHESETMGAPRRLKDSGRRKISQVISEEDFPDTTFRRQVQHPHHGY
jgi:hypothetical protein